MKQHPSPTQDMESSRQNTLPPFGHGSSIKVSLARIDEGWRRKSWIDQDSMSPWACYMYMCVCESESETITIRLYAEHRSTEIDYNEIWQKASWVTKARKGCKSWRMYIPPTISFPCPHPAVRSMEMDMDNYSRSNPHMTSDWFNYSAFSACYYYLILILETS